MKKKRNETSCFKNMVILYHIILLKFVLSQLINFLILFLKLIFSM